jgi:DNA (cytosine-5)-methyltransferase 1
MAKKYSIIKEEVGIEIDRKSDYRLAHLTHHFQNQDKPFSKFFEKNAKEYLNEVFPQGVKERSFQHYLPITWDIPFPPKANPKFRFIDLFAGIGGIRLAFQNQGGKCVFTSEWDVFAKKTYEANFGEVPFGDITQISEKVIPDHDILLAGFPCQPFSIAGVSKKKCFGSKTWIFR